MSRFQKYEYISGHTDTNLTEKLYVCVIFFSSQGAMQFSTNLLVRQRRSEPDICPSLPPKNSSGQRWHSVLNDYYSFRISHLIVVCMSSAEIVEAAALCAVQSHRETVRAEVFQVRQKRRAARRNRLITVCPHRQTRAAFLNEEKTCVQFCPCIWCNFDSRGLKWV